MKDKIKVNILKNRQLQATSSFMSEIWSEIIECSYFNNWRQLTELRLMTECLRN